MGGYWREGGEERFEIKLCWAKHYNIALLRVFYKVGYLCKDVIVFKENFFNDSLLVLLYPAEYTTMAPYIVESRIIHNLILWFVLFVTSLIWKRVVLLLTSSASAHVSWLESSQIFFQYINKHGTRRGDIELCSSSFSRF